jgi:5-methyltetrahydrofolate--homocysteine methyltransferase
MNEVGRLYEIGESYVPEMLIAARAMQTTLDILEPLLGADGLGTEGKVAIGTVAGDLHDIGKNLVAMMLGGAGFEVIDLGTNVTPTGYVEAIREHEPDIVGLSALLTTTMAAIEDTIAALAAAGLRQKVKVIIGGAPITQNLADKIGADGYAPDAASAARMAKAVMEPD